MASITPAAMGPDHEFETECVEFFAAVANALSVPRSYGQIYGILYASPEPLTFTEVVAKLRISKGSVSQGLALLRSLGAVNEVVRRVGSGDGTPAGSDARTPRTAYAPELSLRRLISGILLDRISPLATESATRLERLVKLASASPQPSRRHRMAQAKRLTTWRRQLKAVLPMLTMLLGPAGRTASFSMKGS